MLKDDQLMGTKKKRERPSQGRHRETKREGQRTAKRRPAPRNQKKGRDHHRGDKKGRPKKCYKMTS
jgi:hypothetical protein